jgi:hypothetical protein
MVNSTHLQLEIKVEDQTRKGGDWVIGNESGDTKSLTPASRMS